MSRKEEMENLVKLAEEKREEIIAEIIQAYKDADRSDLSGWKIDVCIDDDGEVFATGLMSQNSMLKGQFEGSVSTIAVVPTHNLLDNFNLTEAIRYRSDYEELYKKYEDSDYYNFYDFIADEYSEIKEELENEYIEFMEDEIQRWAEQKFDEFIDDAEQVIGYDEE